MEWILVVMTCQNARQVLWPLEQPKLACEDVVSARHHLDGCASCRDFFAQDRRLVAIYHRLEADEAPSGLRDRVARTLAWGGNRPHAGSRLSARLGQCRRWWKRMGLSHGRLAQVGIAAGMALLVFVVGASSLAVFSGPEDGMDVFVDDYLRRAVSEDRIDTGDEAEVARFLTRELGVVMRPLAIAGLRLTGAEICLLRGQRGAMIRYDRDGTTLSHYVIPDADVRVRAPAVSRPEGSRGPAGTPADAPSVITWADASTYQALVGAVPAAELLTLVRDVAGAY